MSTFNRNTLALALAAALLPASAFAFDVSTAGDTTPETIATQVGTAVTMTEAIELNADGITDQLIGRTTGFGVRLLLPAGVTVVSATLADGTVDLTPDSNANATDDWTASAGIFVSNAAVWNVQPSGANATINAGTILNINSLSLTGVALTGNVQGTIQLFDPNTNAVIAQANATLINRANGVTLQCDTSLGDVTKRIDVASDQNTASKTLFTPGPFLPNPPADAFGAIGSALNGNGETFFNAGEIDVFPTAGVTFAFAAGDDVDLAIDGTFGAAVTGAFLSTSNDCSVVSVAGVINVAGTQVTFSNLDPSVLGTFPKFFCVTVDGTTVIDQSTFSTNATFTRGADTSALSSCSLLPMQFNGSVVKVFTFNPAGNTTQESFARVTNWGNTGGKVTVQGWDDSGAAAPGGNVTFNLSAGETVQFNSTDLENGGVTGGGKALTGALGNGTGKWRLIVTGEFDGMAVTSLNRNNTTGTLTNLTDADNRGEQVNDGK